MGEERRPAKARLGGVLAVLATAVLLAACAGSTATERPNPTETQPPVTPTLLAVATPVPTPVALRVTPARAPTPVPTQERRETPTSSPTTVPTPTPTPTPTVYSYLPARPGTLQVNAMARVLADDLVVRSAPSVGAGSTVLTPHLRRGDRLFVIAGPRAGSGYRWYLVDPLAHDSATSAPLGWVAAASRVGEPWIEGIVLACPSLPVTITSLAKLAPTERVACFGGATLTFEAYDTSVGTMEGWCTGEPGWLNYASAWTIGDRTTDHSLPVVFAPELTGMRSPDFGVPLRITGHFDDPASASCSMRCEPPDMAPFEESGASQQLGCRAQFVVTERVPLAGP